MGAGLAGLACAITLEQMGIEPAIFEDRRQVEDRFVNGEIFLSILDRPIYDPVAYLSEEHNIYITPAANIRKLVLFGPTEKATITGHLGFTNIRGRHKDSLGKKLVEQVNSQINFGSTKRYEELQREYTHVVLATGDASYTQRIQDYQQDLTVTLKGATVEGDFDRYTVAAWLDYNLANQGYCYFIPYSQKEANIVLGLPNYPVNENTDLDQLWEKFYQRACKDLGQDLRITDRFQITKYIIGVCEYPRIGNTFFVGNCFGSIMPFLGFGQLLALLTGIYAAHDIAGQGHYEELTKPLRSSYQNSLVLRRYLEGFSNESLDKLISKLDTSLGNKIFNLKHFDSLKVISKILAPFVNEDKKQS